MVVWLHPRRNLPRNTDLCRVRLGHAGARCNTLVPLRSQLAMLASRCLCCCDLSAAASVCTVCCRPCASPATSFACRTICNCARVPSDGLWLIILQLVEIIRLLGSITEEDVNSMPASEGASCLAHTVRGTCRSMRHAFGGNLPTAPTCLLPAPDVPRVWP